MDDVGVIEHADNLRDRLGLTDVRQELVTQAFTLGGALDNAGDVHEGHGGRQQARRAEDLGQLREPRVRQVHDANVGLDRGERVVRREHLIAGQCVEKG